MKKTALILSAFMLSICCFPVKASIRPIRAVITYYWPLEAGGKYDCDGNPLHKGIAAVDFDVFPKGSILRLSNGITLIAKDCGGSDVISRKAAHERGERYPVIDVWVRSAREAKETKVVLVTVLTHN
jgi:3D (Asp-Asp-Asp) domain-containing protein